MKKFLIFAAGLLLGLAAAGLWYTLGTPGLDTAADADDASRPDAPPDRPITYSIGGESEESASDRPDPSTQTQPEPVEYNGRLIQTGATDGEPPTSDRVEINGRVIRTRPFPDPNPEESDRGTQTGDALRRDIQRDRTRTLREILAPLPVDPSDN